MKRASMQGDDNLDLDKLKTLDPGSMPPCERVLISKIKRANFVARLWKQACTEFYVHIVQWDVCRKYQMVGTILAGMMVHRFPIVWR